MKTDIAPQSEPPLDWTRISDDPNNSAAKARVRRYLREIERVHSDTDITRFIEQAATGKRMLDIGMVNHTRHNWHSEWRHGRFAKVAAYCLGIDILDDMVNQLAKEGYNVRTVDATSDTDLGDRFEIVFGGDVIEHVDNAVALMKFAARHLAPGGRIFMSTPNPFSRKFVRQFKKQKAIIVNLDHVAWVSPTQAIEIAHRSGLMLRHLHLIKRMPKWKMMLKRFTWRYEPVEYTFPDYLYEFVRAEPADRRPGR
jgi:2-polyprenyl-3-methyl-5-hydroxy-6-metoxy-1,4-benzoquinol methylase